MAPKTYTPPPPMYRAAVALQKAVAQLQACGPLWGRWWLPWHRPAWAMKVDLAVTHLGTAAALLEEQFRPAVSATAASGSATNAAASARNAGFGGLVLDATAFLGDAKVPTTDAGAFADWTPAGDGFSVPPGKYAWADNPPAAGDPPPVVYVGMDLGRADGDTAVVYDPRADHPFTPIRDGKSLAEWQASEILAVASWGDREGMAPASETDKPHPTDGSTVYHDLEYAADVLESAQFTMALADASDRPAPNAAHDALLAVQVAMAKLRAEQAERTRQMLAPAPAEGPAPQPDAAMADLLNTLGDVLTCAEQGVGRVVIPPAHFERLREAVRQVSLRAQRADSLLLPTIRDLLTMHAQGGRGAGWAEAWKRLRTIVGLIESARV